MINSHLLYRLSYRGTTTRMLLIKKEKSTFWMACCSAEVSLVRHHHSFDGILPFALHSVIGFTKNGAWRMAGSRKRFYVCCMCVLILSYAMLSVAGMGIALPL